MPKNCPVCKKTLESLEDKLAISLQKLGLSGWDRREVTSDVVKKAFRKISRKDHPDQGGAQDTFVDIVKARDTVLASLKDLPRQSKKINKVDQEQIVNRINNWRPGQQCPWCGRK